MQNIRQLRILARDMGVSVAELIHRRQRHALAGKVLESESGTLRIRERVHCDPKLNGWKPVYGTVRR